MISREGGKEERKGGGGGGGRERDNLNNKVSQGVTIRLSPL